MANVNISQIRTIVATQRPGRVCLIHASVLLGLIEGYKSSAGSDAVLSQQTPNDPQPPLDLTRF